MFDWFKTSSRRNRRYIEIAGEVLTRARTQEHVSDEELAARWTALKNQLAEHGKKNKADIIKEGLVVAVVAGRRHLGFWAHSEQLWGALALIDGHIAEMRTGEGKTFTAVLAASAQSLVYPSVHLATANAYLARRDCEQMRPVYEALGLTVGCTWSEQSREEKKVAYSCSVTYSTSTELGFDFLRDNLVVHNEDRVQGPLSAVIVDEVDSLLIDEARTPLVISGDEAADEGVYERFRDLVAQMTDLGPTPHYEVDHKLKRVELTDEGLGLAEAHFVKWQHLEAGKLYDPAHLEWSHYLDVALRAKALVERDVDYMVDEGQVKIVDQHTGRVQADRRWDGGLHQAVEVKEGLPPSAETTLLASISIQQYFAHYETLAGMTGTAATEAEEFRDIYGKEVVEVATHKTMVRVDHPDVICVTKADKLRRIADEVAQCHEQGRPVLVGTPSVAASEEIAELLASRGLAFEILNARQHDREAAIIAEAGRPGAITVTTAMAGRGTDIVLGGEPGTEGWQERHDAVVALGGLHVLGTERHESRRIDNQLRGRAGRQGDPGSSRFYLSMEDNLLRIFASGWAQSLLKTLGIKEGNTIESPTIAKQIERAQKQVEAHHFEARKALLEFDSVINLQREVFYEVRNEWVEGDWDWTMWDPMADEAGVDLSDRIAAFEQLPRDQAALIFLVQWDLQWRAFLDRLSLVRQGIHLRGMAQQKPLQEYQKEAVRLFAEMERLAWEEASRQWEEAASALLQNEGAQVPQSS